MRKKIVKDMDRKTFVFLIGKARILRKEKLREILVFKVSRHRMSE